MNALVTYVSHCHPLGGKCVLQAKILTKLVSFHLKLPLETMSLSLFLFITVLFYHISPFAAQEHCHSICLDTGIDYRKREMESSERLYYM